MTKAARRVHSGSVTRIPTAYRLVDGTHAVIVIRPLTGRFVMPNERTRDVGISCYDDAAAADHHEYPPYD